MGFLRRLLSQSWTTIFSGLSTFAVRFVLLALFGFLVIVIVRGLKESGYKVEAFQVPKKHQDAGFNGQVVAYQIQDQVRNLKLLANSRREDSLQVDVDLRPDLKLDVMGVGLSASTMIYHIRELLGRENYTIGGDITDLDNIMSINLRMTGFDPFTADVPYDEGKSRVALKEVIDRAAMEVLRLTDPYRLALVHQRRGNTEKSEEVIRYMISELPEERKWAYNFWAGIKEKQGDKEKSIQFYRKAIEEDENFTFPLQALAWKLFSDKAYEEALELFERLLIIDPKHGSARNGAALCYRQFGELGKAEEYYKKQLEVFPEIIWGYQNYGYFLLTEKKDTASAIKLYEKAGTIIPESGDLYVVLSTFHLLMKDTAKAMQYTKQTLELEPDNVSALFGMSNYEFGQTKDFAKAEEYTRTLIAALEVKGYDIGMQMNAYNTLALAEYEQMKLDSSIIHAKRSISLIPEHPMPWSTLAEAYLLQGNESLFYETIQKSIDLGMDLEPYLEQNPYNKLKDQSRLRLMLAKQKKETALKG